MPSLFDVSFKQITTTDPYEYEIKASKTNTNTASVFQYESIYNSSFDQLQNDIVNLTASTFNISASFITSITGNSILTQRDEDRRCDIFTLVPNTTTPTPTEETDTKDGGLGTVNMIILGVVIILLFILIVGLCIWKYREKYNKKNAWRVHRSTSTTSALKGASHQMVPTVESSPDPTTATSTNGNYNDKTDPLLNSGAKANVKSSETEKIVPMIDKDEIETKVKTNDGTEVSPMIDKDHGAESFMVDDLPQNVTAMTFNESVSVDVVTKSSSIVITKPPSKVHKLKVIQDYNDDTAKPSTEIVGIAITNPDDIKMNQSIAVSPRTNDNNNENKEYKQYNEYKDRLIQFYGVHNASKANESVVNMLLNKYQGNEITLFAHLDSKYIAKDPDKQFIDLTQEEMMEIGWNNAPAPSGIEMDKSIARTPRSQNSVPALSLDQSAATLHPATTDSLFTPMSHVSIINTGNIDDNHPKAKTPTATKDPMEDRQVIMVKRKSKSAKLTQDMRQKFKYLISYHGKENLLCFGYCRFTANMNSLQIPNEVKKMVLQYTLLNITNKVTYDMEKGEISIGNKDFYMKNIKIMNEIEDEDSDDDYDEDLVPFVRIKEVVEYKDVYFDIICSDDEHSDWLREEMRKFRIEYLNGQSSGRASMIPADLVNLYNDIPHSMVSRGGL